MYEEAPSQPTPKTPQAAPKRPSATPSESVDQSEKPTSTESQIPKPEKSGQATGMAVANVVLNEVKSRGITGGLEWLASDAAIEAGNETKAQEDRENSEPANPKEVDEAQEPQTFDEPQHDPAYKEMLDQAVQRSSQIIEQRNAGNAPLTIDDVREIEDNELQHATLQFAYQHPDKAKAYAERDPNLKAALESITKNREPTGGNSEPTDQKPNMSNTEGKRFTLSKETFAKERIDGLKDVVADLKKEHPEVLSFAMFGSMVKGTAREASDIDGYLYVDADLAKEFSGQGSDVLQKSADGKVTTFSDELQQQYEQEIRNKLKGRLNLSDEQVRHIRVRPINEQIVDDEIAKLDDYTAKAEQFKQESASYWDALQANLDGKGEIPDPASYPQYPDIESSSTNIFPMFHLKVGNGIEKYRAYLIDRLSQMGERGEKIWQQVIESTESLEQNLQSNTGKRYPRTLEEAASVYG